MEIKEFEKIINRVGYKYDISKVFNDFLEICICCFAMLPTRVSRYEESYMATIGSYTKDEIRDLFPKLMAQLIIIMEKYHNSSMGNDVLGTYYEQHLSQKNKGQFFTPFPICILMASINDFSKIESQSIIDPCCGSGRLLLAGAQTGGKHHKFYGVDISLMCVKITVVNMFLNGLQGEVMCADALNPNDFNCSYVVRRPPFGITKITNREESELWNRNLLCFPKKEPQPQQLSLF